MKKSYILFSAFFVSYCLNAQQPSLSSLYMLNPYNSNPAAAGLSKTMIITGGFRTQWVGIEGNPKTTFVTAEIPLSIISSGVGISIQNETIGARSGINAKASYNYILKMGEGQLSFGAAAGIVQGTLDGLKLRTPEGDYNQGVADHRDNLLSLATLRGITPTFDAGVYYKNERIEGGITILNITQPRLNLDGTKSVNVMLKRGYNAMVAAHFDLSSTITLHPSVIVRSDAIQTQMDFSTFLRYNDNFFLGASFRGYNKNSIDALTGFGGLKLNPKLTLAYAYDVTLSVLKNVTRGSHEILLQYNLGKEFGKGKLPPIIYNPRF
jgi:type IX secretion system PorP/SprF family membrane protein